MGCSSIIGPHKYSNTSTLTPYYFSHSTEDSFDKHTDIHTHTHFSYAFNDMEVSDLLFVCFVADSPCLSGLRSCVDLVVHFLLTHVYQPSVPVWIWWVTLCWLMFLGLCEAGGSLCADSCLSALLIHPTASWVSTLHAAGRRPLVEGEAKAVSFRANSRAGNQGCTVSDHSHL